MPIYLKKDLPLKSRLNIKFLPNLDLTKPHLKIGILNLMPAYEETEAQFLQVLNDEYLQVEIDFIYLTKSQNIIKNDHFQKYYLYYQDILNTNYDGFIITGAPLEHLNFIDIPYLDELKTILSYTKTHVKSTIFICWASEFALYYFYGINRVLRPTKASGVYSNYLLSSSILTNNFPDYFSVPISRYCDILESSIFKIPSLKLVSKSNETGPLLIEDSFHNIFITGHFEYSLYTLHEEYLRDLKKGLNPSLPKNYYYLNNPQNKPLNSWFPLRYLFFHNWLYYYCLNN